MTESEMTPEKADYIARMFVNGPRRHGVTGKMVPASGEFAPRFASHPWCREATTEGWAKELRGHLVTTIVRRIWSRQPYDMIETLMPPREWVDTAKLNAARTRSATEWRDQRYGKIDGEQFLKAIGIHRPVDKFDENGEVIE